MVILSLVDNGIVRLFIVYKRLKYLNSPLTKNVHYKVSNYF
jgi:hypothetical protein